VSTSASIDLADLRDRLHVALPPLALEMIVLEHSETGDRHPALSIEDTGPRKKDHVYKMTVAVFDEEVTFFVHVHGRSGDLTTQGAQRFSKACPDIDEVFAIVCSCWTGSVAS